MTVKIQVEVFLVVMLSSVVVAYRNLIGPFCLHLQGTNSLVHHPTKFSGPKSAA